MKKKMLGFLLGLFLLVGITSSASAYGLENWFFDIDGAGGEDAVQIYEYFDLRSPNLVDTDYDGSSTTYSFTNYGVAKFTGYDGTSSFAQGDLTSGGVYELTAIYTFTGTADLVTGTNTFTGGNFDIYFDDGSNTTYGDVGDALTYLGANDGDKIASFNLLFGSGTIGTTGLPNGQLSITYAATNIEAGYFFAPDGTTDLATTDPITMNMGFSTTNASQVTNPSNELITEMSDYANYTDGDDDIPDNEPPVDFWLSANGQFRLDVVPEPTTMLLFGFGLLSVAGISRRKVS